MNLRLKRRLIVAIVILALIVIFVPMLFKRSQNYYPHKIVMTTPAIPPQQPQIAPSPEDQQPVDQNRADHFARIPPGVVGSP